MQARMRHKCHWYLLQPLMINVHKENKGPSNRNFSSMLNGKMALLANWLLDKSNSTLESESEAYLSPVASSWTGTHHKASTKGFPVV